MQFNLLDLVRPILPPRQTNITELYNTQFEKLFSDRLRMSSAVKTYVDANFTTEGSPNSLVLGAVQLFNEIVTSMDENTFKLERTSLQNIQNFLKLPIQTYSYITLQTDPIKPSDGNPVTFKDYIKFPFAHILYTVIRKLNIHTTSNPTITYIKQLIKDHPDIVIQTIYHFIHVNPDLDDNSDEKDIYEIARTFEDMKMTIKDKRTTRLSLPITSIYIAIAHLLHAYGQSNISISNQNFISKEFSCNITVNFVIADNRNVVESSSTVDFQDLRTEIYGNTDMYLDS